MQAVTPNANATTGLDTVKMYLPTAVVVMDSGVDCFHRDLNVIYNRSFVRPTNPTDPAGDTKGCWDVYNHGTNVAGMASRSVCCGVVLRWRSLDTVSRQAPKGCMATTSPCVCHLMPCLIICQGLPSCPDHCASLSPEACDDMTVFCVGCLQGSLVPRITAME